MENHALLYTSQYGFRKNRSCQDAICELVSDIIKEKELGHHVISVFLDLSKAFDTLDHKILLDKLELYGIRGVSNDWFRDYLSDRKLQVKCSSSADNDNANSIEYDVNFGCPQGSNLGPLLFIIFSNDVINTIENSKLILFADDTTIYMSHRNKNYLIHCLIEDIEKLADWFNANKLSLNLSKTVCMAFDEDVYPPLTMNNYVIPMVWSTKFLGVYLDKRLDWKEHFNKIYNKIRLNSKLLQLTQKTFDESTKLLIYNAHIQSHIMYSLALWGTMITEQQRNQIYKVQKKCMRWICGAKATAHTMPLFKKLRVLKIDELIILETSKIVHGLQHGWLPPKVSNTFNELGGRQMGKKVHKYNTRQKLMPNIMPHKSTMYNKSVLCKVPSMASKIPIYLLNIANKKMFSRKYKQRLLSL